MHNFSQNDMQVADRLGRIEEKVDILIDHDKEWKRDVERKIELHNEKLEQHTGLIKKVSGVIAAIQVLWITFISFFSWGHK